MFGNINDRSRRDESSRSLGGKDIKLNVKKSNIYDETTYSISSEDDSDESQKLTKKSKNCKNNKSPKTDELELVKKENIELKLKNDVLMMINNVSESMLKNNNLLFDLVNEIKILHSRLEKLENLFKNELVKNDLKNILIDDTRNDLKDRLIIDNNNLPIGDDSSLNMLSMENNLSTNKSPVSDKSASMLPKIT